MTAVILAPMASQPSIGGPLYAFVDGEDVVTLSSSRA